MTRTQAAYQRSVKARLAKMGAADKFSPSHCDQLFDNWKTPAQAAEILAAPLPAHDCWRSLNRCGWRAVNAKTPAERQADRKARELAAGRVQWKRWVHPDDVPALSEYADKLAKKRARAEQKAG